MKLKNIYAFLLAMLTVSVCLAQNATRPQAPVLPKDMNQTEHEQLYKVINFLANGEFESASMLIEPLMVPSNVKIYASWASLPRANRDEYRKAAQDAVNTWNSLLANSVKFEFTEDEEQANIRLLFEYDVAQITAGQFRLVSTDSRLAIPKPGQANNPTSRASMMRVATMQPYTEMAQPAMSINHMVSQGLGVYLGLAVSPSEGGVMGPVWTTNDAAKTPSEAEVKMAKDLLNARRQLMEACKNKVALYMPKPKMVIEAMEIDGGKSMRGDTVHYTFKIKNVGDAPLTIDAKPNCGCTVANYDREIAPGAEGKIEAELKTGGFRGPIVKAIDLTTNDPDSTRASLRMTTNVVAPITIVPSETVNLVLEDSSITKYEAELDINVDEAIEITKVSASVPYVEAKVAPVNGDPKKYRLLVEVKPEAPVGRGAFLVTAMTNSSREPQVNLSVSYEKGIIVTPAQVYMGTIQTNTPLPIEQIVTLVKRTNGFQVEKVESDDPTIQIQHESLENGTQHRIILRYNGGWQSGQIRHKLTVKTNDSRQPTIEIPVFANVIGASEK